MYEASDEVWNDLNKSHHNIIWHKTHVLEHREKLEEILQNAVATGESSVSMVNLDDYDDAPATTPTPGSKRKRSDEAAPPPKRQGVDVSEALLRMSEVMDKRTETAKSKLELATELLENEYVDVLNSRQFSMALDLLEQPSKATIFVTLKNPERRTQWLVRTLGIQLGSPE